jgi:hypothetical protein
VSKVRAKYIEADKVLAEQGSGDSNKADNVNYDHLLFDKKIALAIEDMCHPLAVTGSGSACSSLRRRY